MAKRIRIVVYSVVLFASCWLFSLDAFAETNNEGAYTTKDEVVYGNLDSSGDVKDIYVVNSFTMKKAGDVTDYGAYESVRNLTDLSPIELNKKNEVRFSTEGDAFYYQGELTDNELPWDFSISYKLDGKKVHPEELAGKSGLLDIEISVKENGQFDSTFFEYYLVQISLVLDPVVFHHIQAPKGTKAKQGKSSVITFTTLPNEEEMFLLHAEVENFEMEPIEIAAVPANISFEDPDFNDMTGEMDQLADAISQIDDGIVQLRDALSELANGAGQLASASGEFKAGLDELNQSSTELTNGSKEILDALKQIEREMAQAATTEIDLEAVAEFPSSLRTIAGKIRQFGSSLDEHEATIAHVTALVTEVIEGIEGADAFDSLAQTDLSFEEYKIFSQELAATFEQMADEIERNSTSLANLSELQTMQQQFKAFVSGYETFHYGLVAYTGGVSDLAAGYGELHNGLHELADGASRIYDGANELQRGTNQLRTETSGLPSIIEKEIEAELEKYDFSDFEPVSFVSEKNKRIGVVQFVLHTETIELEEEEMDEIIEEEQKGLWERFLDLFR